MAKKKFKTEINQLLNMMINSLYSNKEISLRELISNSSDALDKLRYLTITDDEYKKLDFIPEIKIGISEKNSTLTISDNGIGMDEDDLNKNLGTIANSGTKSFIEGINEKENKDSGMIGQFGVGFYSAFMLAKKVEVVTKKANSDQAFIWSSEGTGSYSIDPTTKDSFGTSIKLYLKDEEVNEFTQTLKIESIVERYSNHISYPIMLKKGVPVEPKEGEKEDKGNLEYKFVQINKADALWMTPKSKITDDDYKDFYKTLSVDTSDPVSWIHNKIEGTHEYTTLFYIPDNAPIDLYRVDYKTDVKLYVNKVFITSGSQELMPTYLRFIKGIIDSADLPLNVSREILQNNQILQKIKDGSVKKILEHLKYLLENEKEKYRGVHKNFGNVLKEGVYSDIAHREEILDILLFKSLKHKEITLAEYIANMSEKQEEIYVTYGKDYELAKNSPLLDKFKKDGYDVIIFTEDIDKIIFPTVFEYKEKKLINAEDAKIDSEDIIKENDEALTENKDIIEEMKTLLADEVNDVKVDLSIDKHSASVMPDKNDPSFQTAQFMRQMGKFNEIPDVKLIMSVNTKSTLFEKLKANKDKETRECVMNMMLYQAKLANGEEIKDTLKLSANISTLMQKVL